MRTALTATNIRVFEAVARLQSVTRAAEELETSQPYVSKQIAAMEAQLNVPLLTRLLQLENGELVRAHENDQLWRIDGIYD